TVRLDRRPHRPAPCGPRRRHRPGPQPAAPAHPLPPGDPLGRGGRRVRLRRRGQGTAAHGGGRRPGKTPRPGGPPGVLPGERHDRRGLLPDLPQRPPDHPGPPPRLPHPRPGRLGRLPPVPDLPPGPGRLAAREDLLEGAHNLLHRAELPHGRPFRLRTPEPASFARQRRVEQAVARLGEKVPLEPPWHPERAAQAGHMVVDETRLPAHAVRACRSPRNSSPAYTATTAAPVSMNATPRPLSGIAPASIRSTRATHDRALPSTTSATYRTGIQG